MRAALIAASVALAGPALAGPPQWTWEAGKQTNNGAITVNSVNGSTTYSGTQNPTGAVAKMNQSAVTQPPTVIIQATGGGLPFNYKDDCWVIDLVGHGGFPFIGAGKVDTVALQFTGIMGSFGNLRNDGTQPGYNAGDKVLSMLTGSGVYGLSGPPKWCGADAICAWKYGDINGAWTGIVSSQGHVVAAAALPINSYTKCYP